jgi:hypothetical protein
MTTEVSIFVINNYMVFCVSSVLGLQFEYSWENGVGVRLAAD